MTTFNRSKGNLYGISLMLLNALAVSLLYSLVKELTKTHDSNLVVFAYKSLILICIIPWCLKDGLTGIKSKRIHVHALRGFLSITGTLCLFASLKHIPLADATALGYLEQILLVIIGMTYFKERVSKTKIFCVFTSFVGALFIIYPNNLLTSGNNFISTFHSDRFNTAYILVFISVVFWTLNCVVIKIMGATETNKSQVMYGLIFQLLFAMPITFFNWSSGIPVLISPEAITITQGDIAKLLLLGLCYLVHSNCFFLAFKHSEISAVIPFDYSRLICTAVLGYVMLNEIPAAGAIFGYTLIISSGLCLIKAEANYRKRASMKEIKRLEDELEHQ
jgi:drug/metabolite transporter (DMT)-like permease